jgi:hypothetical protein
MMNINKISTTHSNIQYVTYFVNVHHYALETRSSSRKEPHILGPLQDERRGRLDFAVLSLDGPMFTT